MSGRSALAVAAQWLAARRPEKVLDALDRATAEERLSATGWRLRALALSGLDRAAEAVSAAERGLALNPNDDVLHAVIGESLAETDPARSERAWLAALALDPQDAAWLCGYAHVCLLAGQVAKARALVERAATIAPELPLVHHKLALIARVEGDPRGMEAAVRRALAEDPESAGAHALLGVAKLDAGDLAGSERAFGRAVRLNPGAMAIADTARALRVERSPLLWPMWPIRRFGPGVVWAASVVTLTAVERLVSRELAGILAIAWIGYAVYTWTAPPLVRRWHLGRWS